jgi:serine/threonine protein kinase
MSSRSTTRARTTAPYIVMEYVDGRFACGRDDLEERLDPARVVDVGVQVCAGLEHAHATGLVHRTSSPATSSSTEEARSRSPTSGSLAPPRPRG